MKQKNNQELLPFGPKRPSFLDWLKYMVKNSRYFKARRKMERARAILTLANMDLGKLSTWDPMHARRVCEFNQAMIDLTKGKWYMTRAMETASKEDWAQAFQSFRKCEALGLRLQSVLQSNSSTPIAFQRASLDSHNTEISFADGIPLIPEINPVVILKGSDFDMGYQFAQQLIQIFGPWILERKAGRRFTDDEQKVIQEWEKQIQQYAPEILMLCEGWAAGATDAGVSTSYMDVLEIWTGHRPPATTYLGLGDALPEITRPLCSGAAAWGKATSDGRLVTASTGDHDCVHMVTIVAFPERGNNFIFSPFAATGDVHKAGQLFMYGHPGMNNKGLAFVEHGGDPKMIEPKSSWGYGLRSGAAVFHILRFANSAKEAQEMELSFPIGDVGSGGLGTVGFFWADKNYGYILENRHDPLIIREAGVMGENDFLYANNSALHPDAGCAPWMQKDRANWRWDPHGGWYRVKLRTVSLASLFTVRDQDELIADAMGTAYLNSFGRNLFLFNQLNQEVGKIELETMIKIYQRGGTLPPGSWKEIVASYKKTGKWGSLSSAHASNAMVTVMKPDDGDQGIYAYCVGSAARGLGPMNPISCCPIYNETNAFWELQLASSPERVAFYAGQKAQEYLHRACQKVAEIRQIQTVYQPMNELLELAHHEFQLGQKMSNSAAISDGNQSIYAWAKATRAFTRSQVRSLQIIQGFGSPNAQ